MNEVFAAAIELQRVCRKNLWGFCFIGGVAVQRWGEPRFTDDVDLTLLTGFGTEEKYIRLLLQRFSPRRKDAAGFALRNRVLLLENARKVPLDIALGALPFEEHTVQRASPFRFPTGQSLNTCSAEDLIVHKCFANRTRDWLDVEGILARQCNKLDLALIRRELEPLLQLKEEPENAGRLEELIQRYRRPMTGAKRRLPRKDR
jgi:hypothetical protein